MPHYVADLARSQAARGWSVIVASPSEGDLAAAIASAGLPHARWEASRSPTPRLAGEVLSLRRIVARHRPDIMHLHSAKAGLAGRIAIRGTLPTLFQPHAWSFAAARGPLRSATIAWERYAARWADEILCVSAAERAEGERVGISGRWRVVANGVDLDRFRPPSPDEHRAARRMLDLGEEPLVVCAGRLSRQKGQDLLLAAWPAVRRGVPDARLVLVGDGELRDRLGRRLPPGVRLHGWTADVRPWLWAADVVALPSRWEGMALSLLESMACGRSVVASDVSGVREALGDVRDDRAGAVVPPEDVTALADELARRLLDPDLAAAEGGAGRRRVLAGHDRRRGWEEIARLSLEVVRRRGGSR